MPFSPPVFLPLLVGLPLGQDAVFLVPLPLLDPLPLLGLSPPRNVLRDVTDGGGRLDFDLPRVAQNRADWEHGDNTTATAQIRRGYPDHGVAS